MRLTERAFEATALGVLVALLPHLPYLPTWLAWSLPLALGLRVLLRRRQAGATPRWLRLPLLALLIGAIVLDYGNVFGRDAGSALGAGLLVLKLFETENPRDARVALGFAAFVLMSALLFSQTLAATAGICAALVVLLAGLNALEPAPLPVAHPWRQRARIGATLLAVGLPLAIAAFLLIPRLGAPLWGAPGSDTQARSGLGEDMRPGSMTDLLIDDTPALRVRFTGAAPAPANRYFRTLVLSEFDGSTWRSRRDDAPVETLEARDAPIDYVITLEATERRFLPALDMPLAAPERARLAAGHVLVAHERVMQPIEYAVRSTFDYRLGARLDVATRARTLALPDRFNPRARALAERWRGEHGGDVAATASAALALFRADFTYTLSPPLLGRDSVDDFLFETRRGYCEYYSSAFTFLMRAAGVPARVVIGYQGGWWSRLGNYLLLRRSDAHAWSEIWIDGRGWTRVDPTAAVDPRRVELGGGRASDDGDIGDWNLAEWWRGLRNRVDIVNRLWTDAIVQFNALRQRSLLTPFGIADAQQHDLLGALALVLTTLLAAATMWALRRPRAPIDALDAAWARFCRGAARAGVPRAAHEGPLDLLARLRRERPALGAAVAPLVQTYVELRYAQSEPPPEQVARFARAVGELRWPRKV